MSTRIADKRHSTGKTGKFGLVRSMLLKRPQAIKRYKRRFNTTDSIEKGGSTMTRNGTTGLVMSDRASDTPSVTPDSPIDVLVEAAKVQLKECFGQHGDVSVANEDGEVLVTVRTDLDVDEGMSRFARFNDWWYPLQAQWTRSEASVLLLFNE